MVTMLSQPSAVVSVSTVVPSSAGSQVSPRIVTVIAGCIVVIVVTMESQPVELAVKVSITVPAWAGSMQSVSQWQLATLYFLLNREDLALISVWSPTFFLTLLDALEQRADELEALLDNGGRLAGRDLPRNRESLNRLQQFLAGGQARILWPHLKLVSCWADGSSRPFFEQLRQRLPHAAFQGKGLDQFVAGELLVGPLVALAASGGSTWAGGCWVLSIRPSSVQP